MSSGAYPCQGCGRPLCPHPTEQCERGAAISELLLLKSRIVALEAELAPPSTCDICDEKPATRCDECTVNLIRLLDDYGLGQKEKTVVDNLRKSIYEHDGSLCMTCHEVHKGKCRAQKKHKCDKIIESVIIVMLIIVIAYVVIK